MTDIALNWFQDRLEADWTLDASGGLEAAHDLRTAIMLSLFTDRRDDDYVLPDGSGDRRGWWGDTYTATPLGSRLWTMQRAKKSDGAETILRANDICAEALQWLKNEGVVDTISVSSRWVSQTAIAISISVSEPGQSAKKTFQYSWAWNAL